MLYGSRPSDFREEIGRIMRSKNSGIRDDFSLRFMTLESGEAAVVKEAILEERLAPKGPKECTMGSFSSSGS